MSAIVTFYSYKGGAGRTMALANIAVLMAQNGFKVLAVDFDLEAPGLDRYFETEAGRSYRANAGLIDLLYGALEHKPLQEKTADWREHTAKITVGGARLSLITAGRQDSTYSQRVLDFDWKRFFAEEGGGEFFEHLREEWKEAFDFVLIDSRTGITDIGGISTIQLPDVLVAVITPNRQSLEGTKDVVMRAQSARQDLKYDRPPLLVFPLASRFDMRTEFETARKWLHTLANEMRDAYSDWLPSSYAPLSILERTKLPHVAYYTFGESLAVLNDSLSDPESLGYAYRMVAELIQKDFSNAKEFLGQSSLPTAEPDRLSALALQADEALKSLQPDAKRRAWAILTRLVEPHDDGTYGLGGLEITLAEGNDPELVRDLRSLGLVTISAGVVRLAEAGLIEAWSTLRDLLQADAPYLKDMLDVRRRAVAQTPLDETLAPALGWYIRKRNQMLLGERSHIEFSYRLRQRAMEMAHPNLLALFRSLARSTTSWVFIGGSLLILAAAMLLWLNLSLSPSIGWIGISLGYAGVVVAFLLGLFQWRRMLENVPVRLITQNVNARSFVADVAANLSLRGYSVHGVGGTVVSADRLRGPRSAEVTDLVVPGPAAMVFVVPTLPSPSAPQDDTGLAVGVIEGPRSVAQWLKREMGLWRDNGEGRSTVDEFFSGGATVDDRDTPFRRPPTGGLGNRESNAAP